MSDERAIERVLVTYATAIDSKRFELLDGVFLPTAMLDFHEVSGRVGTYLEVRPWLEKRMARFRALHHQLGNVAIEVMGDRATSRAYVRAMHVYADGTDERWFEIGGVYEDELVRTADGFRIERRVLRHVFTNGTLPTR